MPEVIIRGDGEPLVFIPGVQGRWELMGPAVDALAARHRVATFSLGGVPHAACFDAWNARVAAAIDALGARSATIVGISFGGLVGIRFAASQPDRTARLVLVSTPTPGGIDDDRVRGYLKHPRLSAPLFAIRSIDRLGPEIAAARPAWTGRIAFTAEYIWRVLRWPMSPVDMAAWVRAWPAAGIEAACGAVRASTLVITGEGSLDRVVPVDDTRRYLTLIAESRAATIRGTGHLGLLLKPEEFATLVGDFAAGARPGPTETG